MYVRLEEVLGADTANTLMSHLPPVGWADVATKRDLDILESRFDARLDARLATLEVRLTTQMSAQTRTMIIALVTVVMAVASLVVAAG